MKPGLLLSIVLGSAALAAMVFAFLNNASPYVTVSEARNVEGNNLHIVGDIVPNTMALDMRASTLNFSIKDSEGAVVPVRYKGAPPSNMGSVTRVVAVGGMKEDAFQAHKLIIKCPSKYEGEQGAKS
ncbi:MAG TPA: cytochrome c maturation protein CcmE [Fimbriimonadaceae bacterium]|jgi:cytochrome c-type biogenesis protein CcmE|nr:cytochrome c maturation protein CcmE [Fimbriimonadaceae bacterium]